MSAVLKKLFGLAIICMTLLCILPSIAQAAQTTDGIYYSEENNKITINGYDKKQTMLLSLRL